MRVDTEETVERTRQQERGPSVPSTPEMPAITAQDLIGTGTPGELDLFPFFMLMRAHLWRTVICALVGLALAATYAFTRKPRYLSTASILIPQQGNQSAASAALQAATGLDLLGGGYEVYLDILKSRAVQDKLIEEYGLENHYRTKDLAIAELILASQTTLSAAKEGLVTVGVQDEDPEMAANLANSYFSELSQLNARLGITAAGQLRRYYEGALAKERDALNDAEAALEQSQEKTGVLEPQTQATAMLGAEENTRAQLRERQIELEGLLQGATPQNPGVIRLQAEIAGLEGQLRAEQTTGGTNVGTPESKQPAQALDYIRKQREVKFHEDLLEVLTRQVEAARQQESKDISMVELLDAARPTHAKSWPHRKSLILIGTVTGASLGILWTILEALYVIFMSKPINRARFQSFKGGKISSAALR